MIALTLPEHHVLPQGETLDLPSCSAQYESSLEDMCVPGTITISFLRVLSLRSLTSSDSSMPSVNAFADDTNEKTILATFSALLLSFPLFTSPVYLLPASVPLTESSDTTWFGKPVFEGSGEDEEVELANRPVL